MADSNPFAVPNHQPTSHMAANPFDPMGTQAGAHQQPQHHYSSPTAGSPFPPVNDSSNPFGVPQVSPQPNYGQQPPAPSGFAQPGYESYGASPYAPQQSAYGPGSPYAPSPEQQTPPAPQQQQQPSQNAIVVSQYQSNPYAGLVTPAPDPYSSGASQAANPFDPFASAPAPPPVPEPVYNQPPPSSYPSAAETPSYSYPPAGYQPPSYEEDSNPLGPFGDPLPKQHLSVPEPTPEPQQRQYSEQRNERSSPPPEPSSLQNDRNKFSRELSRMAPPGASPLPKAELVRKKGYVLSRISFRTIVTKKWKQSFWVQYGPHTMLWFRSEADFDDWLNNPYHDQSQRNFLIKLAVNFVHDLYKPNVRGYQVTQCRTKAYGKKMVRQFKLERWMDYGPTIAAAFGSYDPKEVDVLREALVDCMRNTPLSGGIRATGAVRQRREEDNDDSERHEHTGGFDSNPHDEIERKDTDDAEGEEADLLDVTNWDDVPAPSATSPYSQQDPTAYAITHASGQYGAMPGQGTPAQGVPQQYQQQQFSYQQYPQQQMQVGQDYQQNALVPVGTPQAYPGAPPPPVQQHQAPAYGYSSPPPDPWAQPPQQQTSPPQQPQYQVGY